MSVEKTMQAYTALVSALTAAITAASKSGLESDTIKAALEQMCGLVENAEE
jgi:hypothetical protein